MKKYKHTNEELEEAQKLPDNPKNDPDCDCLCHRLPNLNCLKDCC